MATTSMSEPAAKTADWALQGVIVTKLMPPRSNGPTVVRDRLVAHPTAKLTAIVAPAGMGKTTLMRQWFDAKRAVGVRAGWFTTDQFDTDSARFLTHCIASLPPLRNEARRRITAAIAAGRIQSALAHWVNAITAESRPTALFIDDLHRAGSVGTWESLNRLVELAPPRMQFFLASRLEPGLPIVKLRVADNLQEIDIGQLAFTDSECIAFLRQVRGIHITDGEATHLNTAVDGWIAALQLAALSGRRLSPAADSNAMLAASRTEIFGFLASEVLDALDDSMRDFLMDTSILERLSAPLCNAVRRSDDSEALLIRAERAGLFLSRLDDRRHWYRYHHLFTAFLRSHMTSLDPDRLVTLHARAAEWMRDNAQMLDAVPHALSAARFEEAADMIELVGVELLETESTAALSEWLIALPRALVSSRLRLCVLSAWLHVYTMDFPAAEVCRRDAERLAKRRCEGAPATADGLLSDLTLLTATIDYMRQGSPGATDQRLRPYSLPMIGNLARSRSLILSAYDARARGDIERAVALFDTAAEASLAAACPWSYLYAVLQLGYLHYLRADLVSAERAYRSGIAYARRSSDEMSPTGLFLSAALAMLHVETMDLGRSATALSETLDALRLCGNDGVYGVAMIEAGRLSLANRQLEDAAAHLSRAKGLLDRGDDRRNWFRANALDIRCALAMSDGRRAARLVDAFGIARTAPAAQDGPLPEMIEIAAIATLGVMNHERRHQEVVRWAATLGSSARAAGRHLHEIAVRVHEAIAWQSIGEASRASLLTERVVQHAGARRVIWPFVDRGPAMDLLLESALVRFPELGDPGRVLIESALRRPPGDSAGANFEDGNDVPGLLYPRERQVLRLASTGLSNRQIAGRMSLAEETIKWYLQQAYQKLQVHNRTHAVTRARSLKLID